MSKAVKEKKLRPYYIDDDSWEDNSKIYSLREYLEQKEWLKGFTDAGSIDIEYCDENGKLHQVGFCIEAAPYCCGLYEIGELYGGLPDRAMSNLFRYIFQEDFAYIINTIPDNKKWETFLKNSTKFKKVKEFKNPNTGNIIKMWISTNKGKD